MTSDLLAAFSDSLADAIAAAAPSVVQVQGGRRPASSGKTTTNFSEFVTGKYGDIFADGSGRLMKAGSLGRHRLAVARRHNIFLRDPGFRCRLFRRDNCPIQLPPNAAIRAFHGVATVRKYLTLSAVSTANLSAASSRSRDIPSVVGERKSA